MRHFPIFLKMTGQRVLVAGGGAAALAKLRLLLKTEARLEVYAPAPTAEIRRLAQAGRLALFGRPLSKTDATGALLIYAASENAAQDARIAAIATGAGVLVNIVDNLADSAFLTPAIVDRDPVTIAIGTQGSAPVLARLLKAGLEARLPPWLGALARAGKSFRPQATQLAKGAARRAFWQDFYLKVGPQAIAANGLSGAKAALPRLLETHLATAPAPPRIDLIEAPAADRLSAQARAAIDRADTVLFDASVPAHVLDLARREARFAELDPASSAAPLPGGRIVQLSAHPARLRMAARACAAQGRAAALHLAAPAVEIDHLPLRRHAS